MTTVTRLASFSLAGFKSVLSTGSLELGKLNVLIGPNGAGKSNFVQFFQLLGWMTAGRGDLQEHIARSGGASKLLFDGPSVTPELEATLSFQTSRGINEYHIRLVWVAGDKLMFAEERYRFAPSDIGTEADWTSLGTGHWEARIIERADSEKGRTAQTILGLMKQCIVYHFHNTTETARICQRWSEGDGRLLKEDAGNLAPFLYRLRRKHSKVYGRIVSTITQVVPFFSDFVLESENGYVMLQWRETGSDLVFDAHQASDGMLRLFSLISLLLQPRSELPAVIILDEPELGLHPFAINIVAGLIRAVSLHSQVIVATQSTTLIDQFEIEDIVVVERKQRQTSFRRLDSAALEAWLEEYTVSELWEKNVLGGRPTL